MAKCLLSGVQSRYLLDSELESALVTQAIVLQWRDHSERCQTCDLESLIEQSGNSRACFDALHLIKDELIEQNEDFPVLLAFWWIDFTARRRTRPALRPLPPHRPIHWHHFMRDVEIHFTINALRRVGIRPLGDEGGCEIVVEELNLPRIREAHLEEETTH